MDFIGTAHGNRIDLDQSLPLSDGTRVRVSVHPENGHRRGDPERLLKLVGTLSDQEAETILKAAQGLRQVDPSLWADPS